MKHDMADEEEWRRVVTSALKGACFDDTLTTRTPDGIRLEPVYPRRTGTGAIEGRAPSAPWSIVQRVDHPDAATALELMQPEIEGGADGVVLVGQASPFNRGFGVKLAQQRDMEAFLDRLRSAGKASIRLDAGEETPDLVRRIGETDFAEYHYGYDPIGLLAAHGRLPEGWTQNVRVLAGHRQSGTVLAADGRSFHEASAPPALELAATLASGLFYLRELERGGMALDEASRCIGFVLAADQNVFATLTKFRALRLLWRRVAHFCDLPETPVHIHAETAWRMQSRRDPATNILRNALATAAAGLGGADSITTLPFTLACGLPDAHARRIARNCQHVLISEANLHRIADPAAGSGGLEAMTSAVCEAAWVRFQEIEQRGGIVEALTTGWLQAEIDRLKPPVGVMVGVNAFTLAAEIPASVLQYPADTHPSPSPALRRARDAEAFEALP